jgi:hypothetical protein
MTVSNNMSGSRFIVGGVNSAVFPGGFVTA